MNLEEIQKIGWGMQISNIEKKQELAKRLANKVKEGDVIGFGSGSTSFLTVCEIARKIKSENIKITAVPTSYEIKMLCSVLNIPTATVLETQIDWSFDGADEVDNNNWLIKGRGAAMFKEKLNIVNSKETYILVDDSKIVSKLCEKNPIPVECYPDSINYVEKQLYNLGARKVKIRKAIGKDGPVITENGNIILDAVFENIDNNLEKQIKSIVGVLETGLFINYNIKIERI